MQGEWCKRVVEEKAVVIGNALRSAAHRTGIPRAEVEDFVGWSWLRLIDDDYSILKSWQQRCSLETYLHTVCGNLARDYRIGLFGRWRPSAAARRLGETAQLAERMVVRERLRQDEVLLRLREHGKSPSKGRLARWISKFPVRSRWRQVDAPLPHMVDTGGVEGRVKARERRCLSTSLRGALRRSLNALTCRERELLRKRFFEGSSIASIAREEGSFQRRLYTECHTALRRLRNALEGQGIELARIREELHHGLGELELSWSEVSAPRAC